MAKKKKKGSKAKAPSAPSGGGLMKNLVPLAIIAAIVGYVVYEVKFKPTTDPVLMNQYTAEDAMREYIESAHAFRTRSPDFMRVEKTVTEEDWDWFQDNAENIFKDGDIFDLSSAIDPSQAAAGARIVVMEKLQAAGPNSDSNEILSVTENGDTATAVVRKVENYGGGASTVEDITVQLVKEGKYWKVKDFAGGRALAEGRMGDLNIVYRDPENLPPAGGAATATAGAPAQPANPALSQGFGGQQAPSPAMAPANQAPANQYGGAPTNAAPQPGAGLPATGGGQAPGTLQQADQAIVAASNAWNNQQYQVAIDQARIAYQIRLHHYGADDPRTQEVMKMGQAAQEMLAKGQAGNNRSSY